MLSDLERQRIEATAIAQAQADKIERVMAEVRQAIIDQYIAPRAA